MTEKNKKKAEAKRHRVVFEMNTGERPHKSVKDYDRKKVKKELKKVLDNE